MAAPLILSVAPLDGETDVVLGADLVVVFDQLIDTTTVNTSTFSVTGPGQTAVVTGDNLILSTPTATVGRQYLPGTFTFATNSSNQTVVTFSPDDPFQPNQTYTVLLVGSNNALLADKVKNLAGEAMANTYQWSFTSGILNLTAPPAMSPLPALLPEIDPASIKIVPRALLGNDISTIDIIFPGPIDPSSFSISDILLSIEPFVQDPLVAIPMLSATAQIPSGSPNIIRITVS